MIIDKILTQGVYEERNQETADYIRYIFDFDAKTGCIIIHLQIGSYIGYKNDSDEVSHAQEKIRMDMCNRLHNELKSFLPSIAGSNNLCVSDAKYEKLTISAEIFKFILEYEKENHSGNVTFKMIKYIYILYYSDKFGAELFNYILNNEYKNYIAYYILECVDLLEVALKDSKINPLQDLINARMLYQLFVAIKYRYLKNMNETSKDFVSDAIYQNINGLSFTLSQDDNNIISKWVYDCINKLANKFYLEDASSKTLSSASGYDSDGADETEESEEREDSQESDESEETEENKDREDTQEGEVSEETEESKEREDNQESDESEETEENKDREDTQEGEVSEETEESEKSTKSDENDREQFNSISPSVQSKESEESDIDNQIGSQREQLTKCTTEKAAKPEDIQSNDLPFQDDKAYNNAAKSLAEASPPKPSKKQEPINNFSLNTLYSESPAVDLVIDNADVCFAAQNKANPRAYKNKSKTTLNQLQDSVYDKIKINCPGGLLPHGQKEFHINQIKNSVGPINDIEILSDIYHFINYAPNKKTLNVHEHFIYDTLFFKKNTNSWQALIDVLRKQAFKVLLNNLGIGDIMIENIIKDKNTAIDGKNPVTIPEPQKVIDTLKLYLEDKLFCEHRSNNFFRNNFHATTAVKNLRKVISVCEAQIERNKQPIFKN